MRGPAATIPTYLACRSETAYVLMIAHLLMLDAPHARLVRSYELAMADLDLVCRHIVLG